MILDMKFIVDNSHREFFEENGWIEFEEVLTPDACTAILAHIEQVFRHRGAPRKVSLPDDAVTLFRASRDVWRDEPKLKRAICHRKLSEIASELVEVKPLRFAYDQVLLPQTQQAIPAHALMGALGPCQGVLVVAAICLEGSGEGILPSAPGHISFIKPETPFVLSALQGTYLFIGYCRAVARYAIQYLDPCANLPKSWGYAVGDRLIDRLHPIVYR
jgi:hypothetical protein